MAENGNLTPKQNALIAALLRGLSVAEACKQCQVAERSAYRWMKLPHVKNAYREARRAVVDKAVIKLQVGAEIAATVLISNLQKDTGVSASIRAIQIRSAEAILERAIAAAEMAELAREVEELRQLLSQNDELTA